LRPFLFACRIVLSEQAFEDFSMTRMYIQPSWIDAASDHSQWSGGNGQYRGDKSADIATFDKQGRARVGAFSDEAIEARKPKKKPSTSIQDKILPQAKRVTTLTNQMRDLVAEYKAGNIDIDEYSMLLSVLAAKRSRAEILLAKAKSVRAPFEMEDEEPISLGKTHVKSEKSFKASKRTAIEENRFKEGCFPTENPKKSSNRFTLSKAADWINNHQFTYFVVCSTIALTAAKLIF
jgi:hypothetical protein